MRESQTAQSKRVRESFLQLFYGNTGFQTVLNRLML